MVPALNQFFLVTVTRMLGKLQQQGLIGRDDHLGI
ncbi:hypothetical protein QUA04_20085 [Microcoleus sp. S13_C5]